MTISLLVLFYRGTVLNLYYIFILIISNDSMLYVTIFLAAVYNKISCFYCIHNA